MTKHYNMRKYGFSIFKCTCGHHHTAVTHKHVIVHKDDNVIFVCAHCRAQTLLCK